MSITQPISEQILDVLKTTIKTVTKANSYNYNVGDVRRADDDHCEVQFKNYPGVEIIGLGVDKTPAPNQHTNCDLRVTLVCYIKEPSDPEQKLWVLMADIEKAIVANRRMNDGNRNLAKKCNVRSHNIKYVSKSGGTAKGIGEMELLIQYRHLAGNPFSQ